ncbi:DUF1565 domain-containing protein [aff. Roholtiella sp. LEGE 12411]|uniref:DUF1565 domain-containing protein n=1 Tax=aff. Roholtiella sp. LEGE 12411 TaxID=1828822 RepID=UPI0018816F2D|nr:DUF1565 domain-containing protein [aff. Roholtiella sp. LEGE 12411]MBE9035651.1 DUF1565 domain-containing protein [aff. Roholtiella sp. LEGE 12411]
MIPPVVFPKYRKENVLLVKLRFLESAMLSIFHPSVLSFTVSMGVVSIAFLGTSPDSAIAQVPSAPDSRPLGEKTISQVNVLFVNPSVGDDNAGNGGDVSRQAATGLRTPLKTITQALRLANANTVIMLSTGTYSAETGEVFPLIMKSGVSIQGDPGNKGKDITIQGGGEYLSRSFGGQNVTIVGASQAVLTGVTVTNSNPRGYGLWIESSNPVIAENTFSGSTQDGISVTGKAAPIISKNYFYLNGANGITIAGSSSAEVRENILQKTGFGINIAQNAAPIVVGNQIQDNRSGILVQANARPILRNNFIQGSKEDGVVAIAQAMPDLGSASEPGGNEFRNNTRYDINASAAKQVISAFGNNFTGNKIAGNVDIKGITAPSAQNQPTPVSNNVGREISFSAPGVSETPNTQTLPLPSNSFSQNNDAAQLNSQLLPLLPANAPISVPKSNQQPPTSRVAGFPIPSSLLNRQIPTGTQGAPRANIIPKPASLPDVPQMNYVRIDPNTIEFTAPQAPSDVVQAQVPRARDQRQPLATLEAAPLGDSSLLPPGDRHLQKQPTPTLAYGGDLPPATPFGVRYRVMVQLATDNQRDLVRSLAPGAFSTVWQGRRVMQAGVFSSEYNAKEMVRTLNSKGLRAVLEPLN